MKKLIFCTMMLSFFARPAMADMFGFELFDLSASFTGTGSGTGLFTTTEWAETSGVLKRYVPTTGTANFSAGSWYIGSEGLLVDMDITNITTMTADGTGTLTLTDVDGDYISADVKGGWAKVGSFAAFVGTLSNVYYNEAVNTTFDAHSGDNVSMSFPGLEPWHGAIVQLTSTGGWFDQNYADKRGGCINAAVVPAPAAVLLGMLGLGVAGIKLRKYA
jgi:hypothetical protein